MTLTLATWNVGPGRMTDLIFLRGNAQATALQEAGDRAGMIRTGLRNGWAFVTGTQPGQASTPLAFDREALQCLKPSRLLVAASEHVDVGAGPEQVKAKWLIGGKFLHVETGRVLWLYSVHYVATQGKPKRHHHALAMSHRIVAHVRLAARPVFVMGDFNAVPRSATLRALITYGMNLAQLVRPSLPTHGRRAIDNVTWTPRRWISLAHTWTYKTHSDHMAYLAEFELTPRRSVTK